MPLVGQNAPELRLRSLDGLPIATGRPAALFFFESNCSWCAVELPKWDEVCARHADLTSDLNVGFFAVATGRDSAQTAQEFGERLALKLPIVLDENGLAARSFELERVPAAVFLNSENVVERIYSGSSEQLSGIIEQAILALARGDKLPDFTLIGSGCGIE